MSYEERNMQVKEVLCGMTKKSCAQFPREPIITLLLSNKYKLFLAPPFVYRSVLLFKNTGIFVQLGSERRMLK